MSTVAPKKKNKKVAASTKKARPKVEARPENSVGIRCVALALTLLLILASASYVSTSPIFIFIYSMVAILGSYLAYTFREKRPAWLGAIPTLATMALFTNFVFELWAGYLTSSASAVGAFIHMITGLLALHSFDLRSRSDFSISALIGLGLLTCISGMARDMLFGFYILSYSILGGLLLFFDSSSRSHEIGPSRSVPEAVKTATGKPLPRRFKATTITAFVPILLLPLITFGTFSWMPRIDSIMDLFVDNFIRAKFPIPSILSEQLGKGGRSQSLRGGAQNSPQQPGASYTAEGGSRGTASSTNPSGKDGQGPANSVSPDKGGTRGMPGSGQNQEEQGQGGRDNGTGQASGGNNKDGKLTFNANPKGKSLESQEVLDRLSRERRLNQAYEQETVELRPESSKMETIILKIVSPQPTYIRRYSLNGYTGTSWTRALPANPTSITPTTKLGYDMTASNAFYIPPNLPTLEVKQDFKAEADLGYTMPATWLPQLVKLKSAEAEKKSRELRVDCDGSIKCVEPITAGTSFTVISQVPVYDLEGMRRLPVESLDQLDEERKEELKVAQSCLELPGGIDKDIVNLAADLTAGDNNWFAKAERICNHLRKNYKYDTSGLYRAGEGASSTDAVHDFLFVKKAGDCRHFATAFAIMCRSQGIPARIVNGFSPGELNKKTGFYEIRGKNAHVWAEIYVPYWNWVPFDPVPTGQLPAHEEGGNPLSRFIRSGLANPFGQSYATARKGRGASSGLGGGPSGSGPDGKGEGKKDKPTKYKLPFMAALDQSGMQTVVKYIAIGLASGLLALLLVLYLKQKEELKRKEILQNLGPVTVIYLDVLESLKRFELLKHPTETADELSFRIEETLGNLADEGRYIPNELPQTVSAFMALYSEERFGGDGSNLDELSAMSSRIKELALSTGKETRNGRGKRGGR